MCIPIESNVSFRSSQVCIFFFLLLSTAMYMTIWVHLKYIAQDPTFGITWMESSYMINASNCLDAWLFLRVVPNFWVHLYMMFCSCWHYHLLYLCPIMWYWQIDNGDIICYQKRCLPDSMDRYRYPIVPSFFEYIHNRQVIYMARLTEYA